MKLSSATPGDERVEHRGRFGPLEREQRLLLHMVEGDLARQAALELLDVAGLGRAVDDEVEMLAAARRHQIVDDPAVLAEQHRIAQPPVLERLEVARQQGLERLVEVGPVEQQLAHVADVEQAGMGRASTDARP